MNSGNTHGKRPRLLISVASDSNSNSSEAAAGAGAPAKRLNTKSGYNAIGYKVPGTKKTLLLFVEKQDGKFTMITDPTKSTFVFPGTEERFFDFALSNPTNNWTSTAEGGYGQVFVFTKGGVQYLLKRGVTSRARGTQSESAIPEIEILMTLDGSKYAMQMDAAIVFDTESYILSRYVPGKTMDKWLATNPSKDERIRVYNELLKGIQEIHSRGIIHRDIKEENIWIPDDTSMPPFYIDFGISVPQGSKIVYIGTEGYKSPYPEGLWSHQSDLNYYSLGVVFEKNPIEGSALGVNLKKQGITNEEVSAHRFEGGRKQSRRRPETRRLKRKHATRRRSTRRT